MSRPKRETKQRDYAKLDTHGFTTSDEDILDVTDPQSNQFDEESDGEISIKEDIQKIIEKSIQQDEKTLYELQGARPKEKTGHSKSSAPKEKHSKEKPRNKKSKSSTPDADNLVASGLPNEQEQDGKRHRKKKEKDSMVKQKVKKQKGEVDLNDLRKNKSLCKLVETQLTKLLGNISTPELFDDSEENSDSGSDNEKSVKSKSAKRLSKKETLAVLDSSTESEENEVTSDSDSSSDSDDHRKKSKKGKSKKRRSGMVKKASDDVVNPQIWPHSLLQYEYVSKSTKYQDLDFRLFVAGELEIITSSKIKQTEKEARLALLKKIVYYSGIYQWKALLEFYAAFVRSIETGQKKWKDDSTSLEVPLLSKYIKQDVKKPF